MARLKLTVACDSYDYLQPLHEGKVQPEGIDLNPHYRGERDSPPAHVSLWRIRRLRVFHVLLSSGSFQGR